ncbi:Hypothetical protein LUCI_4610 [Lucifera butyrica]|uniref:Trimeric lpxa-like n=1 Tax=Lucifera butyrica TaxID=1351585 RepID=A0A498RET5_9FIRM|nr:acyltransferase [Lucifera butyrica]VBB09320.1 Hypothetical protein LUCI_4610 [Lucifera butyrica]
MTKLLFKLLIRNPLRIFSFLAGWIISLLYVDNKSHFLPIICEKPGFHMLKIKKKKASKLIINGTLRVEKRARIDIHEGSTIIINGIVKFGADVHLSAAPGATIILGSRNNGKIDINSRTTISAHERITIGSDCMLSWDILIMDSNVHPIVEPPTRMNSPIHINDNVWIGCRATILKGVTIGQGAVVGAAAVVVRDVPDKTIVAGNPAKVVKENVCWIE